MKRFNQLIALLAILFAVSSNAAEKIYFVHTDNLGSPETLTDENQAVVWRASQDPFGNSAPVVEQVAFDFRFPGQYYDAESGLFYNWNRYYDPKSGRYVTSDPIGLEGGLNTYGYVEGNPLTKSDPEGLTVATGARVTVGLVLFCIKKPNHPICKKVIETCADYARKADEILRRNARRERNSRKRNGQNQSGEGRRNHSDANRGPSGQRPSGPNRTNNRERNRGIDEEHSRVPKSSGGKRH